MEPLKSGIELLHDAIYFIRSNPKRWDQGNWAKRSECGTTMCLAGTACAIAGYDFSFWSGSDFTGTLIGSGYNGIADVSSAAEHLMGLDSGTAYDIFYATRYCEKCKDFVEVDRECDAGSGHTERPPQVEEYVAFVSAKTGEDFSNDFPGLRPAPAWPENMLPNKAVAEPA